MCVTNLLEEVAAALRLGEELVMGLLQQESAFARHDGAEEAVVALNLGKEW